MKKYIASFAAAVLIALSCIVGSIDANACVGVEQIHKADGSTIIAACGDVVYTSFAELASHALMMLIGQIRQNYLMND